MVSIENIFWTQYILFRAHAQITGVELYIQYSCLSDKKMFFKKLNFQKSGLSSHFTHLLHKISPHGTVFSASHKTVL